MSNWFSNNPYLVICFVLYCIYLLCITVNMITIIKKTKRLNFYNKDLRIDDSSLRYFSWDRFIPKF